jgi:hypothetical protein
VWRLTIDMWRLKSKPCWLLSVETTLLSSDPVMSRKAIESSKLGKARGFDGIPNECVRHFSRRPHLHLTHLFNHWLWLGHFPTFWKEAKIITLLKLDDPKFPPNLRSISILSTMGKLFEKLILWTVLKHTEDRNLLNASQFGFWAHPQYDTSLFDASGLCHSEF